MNTNRLFVVAVAAVLLVGSVLTVLIWWGQRPDPSELARSQAFEQHAAICERARESFERRYGRLPPESRTADAIASALDLKPPLKMVPRSNGGHEARIEMPDKYSRLILMWDDGGHPQGYAWEIRTPAANNVSWAEHSAMKGG